jgi:prolyl-tRNA synthetase
MTKLPDIHTHFAEWYQEVIVQAEVIDASPTRGCFVIRPYGYALWENIQKELDKRIKELGAQNAYFPLLIPKSFLEREKKHIKGFSPELAVVTIGGGKELEEPLVVRPTSETIIYSMFAKWISSWRDLPLAVNQWANVVRWEMRTRPFVRSLEFLWQEGHTAHRTHEEAVAMVLRALEIYRDVYENFLAVPAIPGMKTDSERFAGAERTYCVEGLMPDGKALQMATSHLLAHSFPESFDVHYQDQDGTVRVPYCTSWGMTTRSVGAVIMAHGDEQGLVMPPRVAPVQAVLIPIYKTPEERSAILEKLENLRCDLAAAGLRVIIDDNQATTPGAKFFYWELRGVPVRIEMGPKDMAADQVVMVNRTERDKAKKKTAVAREQAKSHLMSLLDTIQNNLLSNARIRMQSQWYQAEKIAEFGHRLDKDNGLYQTGWCGKAECEAAVKEYKGTVRCILQEHRHKECLHCSAASHADILVAKAY